VIALALAARYGAPWLGAMRWVLIAGVVLLALPFPAAALVVIYQTFDAIRYWRTLEVAETVGGLPVPAGSKVHYADKKHSTDTRLSQVVRLRLRPPHLTSISLATFRPSTGISWVKVVRSQRWLARCRARALA
jgi:hypothetical protein